MENTDTVVPEIPVSSIPQKNRLPIIGFVLMLAGPAILMLAGMLTLLLGPFSDPVAGIVAWTAMAFPGVGAIICCIVWFHLWKKTGKLGRALAIITLIMCNPFFYFVYFVICAVVSDGLAGRAFLEQM